MSEKLSNNREVEAKFPPTRNTADMHRPLSPLEPIPPPVLFLSQRRAQDGPPEKSSTNPR
eukprot:361612-Chlamydomonas_euryale.AAC.19